MTDPIRIPITVPADTSGFDKAARGADRLGDELGDLGRDAAMLDRKLATTKRRVGELAREIVRADDKIARADLDKAFGDEAKMLAKLRRYKRAIDDIGDEADQASRKLAKMAAVGGAVGGGGAATAPGGLFGRALGSPLVPALAGIGVAASPLLAGAASGAVVAALGVGGVAAGLAAAFQDNTVKASAASLGHEIRDDFFAAGQGFADSTLESIEKVRKAWRAELGPEFKAITAASEKLLGPLTDSGLGFVKTVMPAIRHAIERAGPVIEGLGKGIDAFGKAIAFTFRSMGNNAEAAGDALADLLVNTAKIVAGLAVLIDGLTKFYAGMVAVREAAAQIGAEIASWFGAGGDTKTLLKDIGDTGSRAFGGIADESEAAAQRVREFNEQVDIAFGKLSNLDNASIDFKLGQIELGEQLKENREEFGRTGKAFDELSEAGLRNRDAVLQQVEAAFRVRDAEIAAAGGTAEATAKANAAFTAKVNAIRAVGVAAGLSGKDLDIFLAKYLNLVRAPNITKVVRFVSDLSNYHPPRVGAGQYVAFAHGGIAKAQRGLVTSSPTVLFGERGTGREAFVPQRGISRSRAASLLGEAASWHGMGVIPRGSGYNSMPPTTAGGGGTTTLVIRGDGSAYADFLARELRRLVRVEGGGNVQLALGT